MKKILKTVGCCAMITVLMTTNVSVYYAKEQNNIVDKYTKIDSEQEIIDNIMREYKAGMPKEYQEIVDFEQIEEDLIYLKSIYPDKTYEELWEKMNQIDSEEEADELYAGPKEETEVISSVTENYDSQISLLAVSSTTALKTTQEKSLKNSEFNETLKFKVKKTNVLTEKTSNKKLKEVLTNYAKAIPGLKETRTADGMCSTMMPQGICNAGSYLLISAYDYKLNCKSVVYIVDRATLTLQTTLALDIKSHVGGIMYDSSNSNMWVCDSDSGYNMRVYKINVEGMVRKGSYSEITCNKTVTIDTKPSCCTIYKGRLWIGTFSETHVEVSKIIGYTISGKEGYELTKGVTLNWNPLKLQGIDFYEINGIDYIAMSTSYGRKNDSNAYVYALNGINVEVQTGFVSMVTRRTKQFVFPSMAEELVHYGGKMYMIYESAAKKFRDNKDGLGISENPCDRITVLNTSYIYQ